MERSATITELAKALAKAQSEFEPATKSKSNPVFRGSKYATLDDVLKSVVSVLAKNELCIMQPLTTVNGGFVLETVLFHSSGEWAGSKIGMPTIERNKATNELQALGIALTYTRRYMLSSLLGISTQDDDDGNASKIDENQGQGTKQLRSSNLATEKQQNAIAAMLKKLGAQNVDKQLNQQGYPALAKITKQQASELFDRLKSAIAAKEEKDAKPTAPPKEPTEEQEPPQEEPVITDENPNEPIIEEDPPF